MGYNFSSLLLIYRYKVRLVISSSSNFAYQSARVLELHEDIYGSVLWWRRRFTNNLVEFPKLQGALLRHLAIVMGELQTCDNLSDAGCEAKAGEK